LRLILQPPTLAAAQAVGAIEDAAAAAASWTPKPSTPTTELSGSECVWDEQSFTLALTIPDERYAARLGEHSQLIETLGCIPSHSGYAGAVARGQHAPASEFGEIDRSTFLDLAGVVAAGTRHRREILEILWELNWG
jgi:hypothetical protein